MRSPAAWAARRCWSPGCCVAAWSACAASCWHPTASRRPRSRRAPVRRRPAAHGARRGRPTAAPGIAWEARGAGASGTVGLISQPASRRLCRTASAARRCPLVACPVACRRCCPGRCSDRRWPRSLASASAGGPSSPWPTCSLLAHVQLHRGPGDDRVCRPASRATRAGKAHVVGGRCGRLPRVCTGQLTSCRAAHLQRGAATCWRSRGARAADHRRVSWCLSSGWRDPVLFGRGRRAAPADCSSLPTTRSGPRLASRRAAGPGSCSWPVVP